ncbi:MAG: hypothetical protein JXR48_17870 [Candidatus Delongbacteria bacterium]|nr:hypothetical protein [Candidatus Delongbacteria bacterium]MBN2836827.1 hypothetical protein [Candidatus Delongbacteria bacterium]
MADLFREDKVKWFILMIVFLFLAIFLQEFNNYNSIYRSFFRYFSGNYDPFFDLFFSIGAAIIVTFLFYFISVFFFGKMKPLASEVSELVDVFYGSDKSDMDLIEINEDYKESSKRKTTDS